MPEGRGMANQCSGFIQMANKDGFPSGTELLRTGRKMVITFYNYPMRWMAGGKVALLLT